VLQYYQQLIALRHAHPALRTGSYQVLRAEDMVYVFARQLDTEELVVAVNAGTDTASVSIEASQLQSKPSETLYGRVSMAWTMQGNTQSLTLELPPRTGCILG
jgi:cyclomaltodextrinase/neopullulanase